MFCVYRPSPIRVTETDPFVPTESAAETATLNHEGRPITASYMWIISLKILPRIFLWASNKHDKQMNKAQNTINRRICKCLEIDEVNGNCGVMMSQLLSYLSKKKHTQQSL